jgi:hypothetical protein
MTDRSAAPPSREVLEQQLDKALTALRMIKAGPVQFEEAGSCQGWCSGVAMSALASIEEAETLGDCFWHPGVPFDMGIQLCDDDGTVREGSSRFWQGIDYTCTGGAHWAGMHIRCTSPAHVEASRV